MAAGSGGAPREPRSVDYPGSAGSSSVVDGRAAGPGLPLRVPHAGRGLASVSGRFGGPAGAEAPGDVVRPFQPGRPARRSPGAAAEDRLAAACRAPAVAGSGQDRACQFRGRPVVSGPWRRLGSSAPSGSWRERRSGCRREDIGRSRVGGRSPCAPVRQSAGARCAAPPSPACGACRVAQTEGLGELAQGGAAPGPGARANRRGSA